MNMQDIESIKYFLKSNPKHSIDIIDYSAHKTLEKKLKYDELVSKYGSLESLISVYKSQGITRLLIQKYKPNGTSNLRVDNPKEVALQNGENLVVHETANKSVAVQPTAAPAVSTYPTVVAPNQQQMFGLNGGFGMNAAEVISLHTKAQRYDELKETNQELKDKNRDLNREIDRLTDENRKLQTEQMFSKRSNELEIKSLKLEDKPALDPETSKALLEVAKNLIPALVQKQSSQVAMNPGMNAAQENLSEIKHSLVTLVRSPQFTDQQANDLVLLAIGQQNVTEFAREVSELVTKYNLKQMI